MHILGWHRALTPGYEIAGKESGNPPAPATAGDGWTTSQPVAGAVAPALQTKPPTKKSHAVQVEPPADRQLPVFLVERRGVRPT